MGDKIQGHTHYGMFVDTTLYTEILPDLWVGAEPRGKAPEYADFILNLYPWGRGYTSTPEQDVVKIELLDSIEQPVDPVQLDELSDWVIDRMKYGTVLVHCQMGIERSPLVVALVLMKLGYTADAAIRLLRDKRDPAVLCNPTFEKFLRGYDVKQIDMSPLRDKVHAEQE